jgi:WD repeat-containing protein 48
VLLSASSDRTVKVWNLDRVSGGGGEGGGGRNGGAGGGCAVHGAGDGHCVATLERHSDYAMALAAPTQPGATTFASAGLGTAGLYSC